MINNLTFNSSFSLILRYQFLGASPNPSTHFVNFHITLPFSLASCGGMTCTSLSVGLLCRNAVFVELLDSPQNL